jgi:hypothetical protein
VSRSRGLIGLAVLARVVGWIGVAFAFRGHWLGVALPLVTTALVWLTFRRGETRSSWTCTAAPLGAESIPGRGSSFWFMLPTEGPVRRPAALTQTP